ncbi:transketolase [Paracidovorax oryzae]|uniref:transketolase n=1 Tax=Paracidovorax oryzae TaxID=862720 RepID=UPI000C1F18E9|nr:transketolase [Paracidovorax oryzae]
MRTHGNGADGLIIARRMRECARLDLDFSKKIAQRARIRCLTVTAQSHFGHLGPDFSAIDILTVLYGSVMASRSFSDPSRDRFVLSKGHAALALYSVLIELGLWSEGMLLNYGRSGGLLGGHPSSSVSGIETCTGALGHGLPFAAGAAAAASASGSRHRTFVLLGDGELQEGSNWEAAMFASARCLGNLTAIVDRNGLQQGRETEQVNPLGPLADKWRAFGWDVEEIDGHDHIAIFDALARGERSTRPRCLIAMTRKGRGVSFMEGNAAWHHKLPSPAEAAQALEELSR